jgi:glutathione-regulated potassium-efflux system protein KefB
VSLLQEAFVFLAAAVLAAAVATRLGLGSVLGYLAAGVAIGPHGLGIRGDADEVLHVAELGVALLLFIVGLELDPRRLLGLRRPVFGLGALQVVGTGAALAAGALALGLGWREAVIVGGGLSLSSTAFVLQLLRQRDELTAPHGQGAFGILLFQDLAVVPMIALLPLLGGAAADDGRSGWVDAAIGAAAVGGVVVASRLVARPALRAVAALRDPEVFTATALLLVVGTAWAISSAGLSMALGAFLAGVLLADSDYRHELEADIGPFKGILLGLFFVGVGMSADVSLLAARPVEIAGLVLGLVLVKGVVAWAIGRAFVGRGEAALSLAVLLSQGGEFAFVLFGLAARGGALDPATADRLVLAVTLSMATTPALYSVHARLVRPRLSARPARDFDAMPDRGAPVLIAGFGRVGQVVARVLRAKKIPFTAIDVNPEHIDFVRRLGNEVFYGDASRVDLLRAAGAERARLFVLAVDDPEASLRTARCVLANFPRLAVHARARNRQHAYALRALGLERVTRETLHSALRMTEGVLEGLGLDHADARVMVERFRVHDEEMLEASWRHQADADQLKEITRRGREELERLFAEDESTR